ncbi:Uu.00g081600.m01.CDS01 [Anthostomella pinea]|uniref:ATP synthase subunit delta, mitochondrial n=1 Tax=Anthostomella pinea TaxID=933095 RepID=A0AAI8YH13_9PEZI|nr:Uu.00g081600.m01.CDS01 [Anthostomella pinea]
MNSFRVARAALRARPSALRLPIQPLQRRTYAEAVPDKARVLNQAQLVPPSSGTNLRRLRSTELGAVPRASGLSSIYTSQNVVQVNIPAESGEMGVLANHVPSIEQLKPGLIEVIEETGTSKQFFLSGGFATVQPNSSMSINAVEGYPLEDFSADAVRSQITEAQKVANGGGSEQDIAEAKIELEVLESLQAVLK